MLKDIDNALEAYLERRPQDREYLTGYFQRHTRYFQEHPEHKAEMVEQLLRNEAMWEEQRKTPPVYKDLTPEEQAKLDEVIRTWVDAMIPNDF